MEEKLMNFTDYCKDFAKTELEALKGENRTSYACDLAYDLTQYINCNGSATYSTYLAKQYLIEWWDEVSDYYEYEEFNFGKGFIHNPFENPEAYMVCMIIAGVNTLLPQCEIIECNWNDEVELTDEFIDTLIGQIDKCDDIQLV